MTAQLEASTSETDRLRSDLTTLTRAREAAEQEVTLVRGQAVDLQDVLDRLREEKEELPMRTPPRQKGASPPAKASKHSGISQSAPAKMETAEAWLGGKEKEEESPAVPLMSRCKGCLMSREGACTCEPGLYDPGMVGLTQFEQELLRQMHTCEQTLSNLPQGLHAWIDTIFEQEGLEDQAARRELIACAAACVAGL